MNEQNIFRVVLLVGFVTVTSIGVWYRIGSYTGEKIDRRQEGLVVLFSLRVVALVVFAGIIAYMIRPQSMSWSAMTIPTWFRWIGAAVGGLSVVVKVWTFHALGKNLTDTVVTREQHTLVTDGPYRWVRHRFYTSFVMDVLAVCLVTANWFLLLGGVSVFAILVIRTRREEDNLIELFGDEYRDYMKQVGRFVPKM